MDVRQVSVKATAGGDSTSVAISGASAQSAALTNAAPNANQQVDVLVWSTVDCFFRHAADPTALSDGTDQFLGAGVHYRISGITPGNKLAFKTTGAAGTVYISAPGA